MNCPIFGLLEIKKLISMTKQTPQNWGAKVVRMMSSMQFLVADSSLMFM